MTRSIPALALMVGGLLFGCGGMPEEGETQEPQAGSEGTVTQSEVTTIVHPGATVNYNSNIDTFTVRDTAADGLDAVATIYNHGTGSDTRCWNSYGPGTVEQCFRNYPNGPRLTIRACTGNSRTGALNSCSSPVVINSFAPTK
ncbi:hypothetical protein EJ065_2003 [Corallococcus coralloides]|uniref:Lipoprotein n=1 Tax=Corallococcus coralloides TaxID=184914 RepID=A0A410RNS7_CORCK|nr:hypothetical protein [Corallococcus coralloides]QAT83589.1 hypothetical protein EJ065_2003 [Corallococcus coralloides]